MAEITEPEAYTSLPAAKRTILSFQRTVQISLHGNTPLAQRGSNPLPLQSSIWRVFLGKAHAVESIVLLKFPLPLKTRRITKLHSQPCGFIKTVLCTHPRLDIAFTAGNPFKPHPYLIIVFKQAHCTYLMIVRALQQKAPDT